MGTYADITVFSLHPRKFITTGEGGMVTTKNNDWASWMNSYKHFGMDMNNTSREGIHFDMVGTNYKLTNFQSAIGLGQFKHIDELLEKRRFLSKRYTSLLSKIKEIKIPNILAEGSHSFQSYCILLSARDKIMNTLRPQGVEVQIGSYALHMHPAYQNKNFFTIAGGLQGSITSFNQCLSLPLFHELTESEQDFVVKKIVELI